MDSYGTQYMTVGDPESVTRQSGSGWIWGILLFILLVVAVIFLILWLVERNKSNDKELSITDAQFTTPSSTSIRATWTAVGNDNDEVTMYVYPSSTKIVFNSSGVPTNTSLITTSAGPVNGNTTKTLTASSNIKSNVTYIVTLIVTNPNVNGYGHQTSQAIVPSTDDKGGSFIITAVGQKGEIVYAPATSSTSASVGYNFTGTVSPGNNLFHHDQTTQEICTVMLSQNGTVNIDPSTPCSSLGSETMVLYDTNPAVVTAPLGIQNLQNPTVPLTDANSKWTYDTTTQKWCLPRNTTNNTTKCLDLLGSDFVDLTNQTIRVTSTTADQTKWVNPNFFT